MHHENHITSTVSLLIAANFTNKTTWHWCIDMHSSSMMNLLVIQHMQYAVNVCPNNNRFNTILITNLILHITAHRFGIVKMKIIWSTVTVNFHSFDSHYYQNQQKKSYEYILMKILHFDSEKKIRPKSTLIYLAHFVCVCLGLRASVSSIIYCGIVWGSFSSNGQKVIHQINKLHYTFHNQKWTKKSKHDIVMLFLHTYIFCLLVVIPSLHKMYIYSTWMWWWHAHTHTHVL